LIQNYCQSLCFYIYYRCLF